MLVPQFPLELFGESLLARNAMRRFCAACWKQGSRLPVLVQQSWRALELVNRNGAVKSIFGIDTLEVSTTHTAVLSK